MKSLILGFVLLFSAAALGIEGTIEDVFCGELDPYAGDMCVVFTTDVESGRKLGLVYEGFDWQERFVYEDDSPSDAIDEIFHCRRM